MTHVAILLPSFGRAAQLDRQMRALLAQALPLGVELTVVLSYEVGDRETAVVCERLIHESGQADVWTVARRNGGTAVEGWNAAYHAIRGGCDYYALGADDLAWRGGWLANALLYPAQVIGLNDGVTDLSKGSSHYLITEEFINEHLGGDFIPPGYHGWWFDREVVDKAILTGVYAPAWSACVEHLHPDWGKAPMDATYERQWARREEDHALYLQRMAEWKR